MFRLAVISASLALFSFALSSKANAQISLGGSVSDSLTVPLLPDTVYLLVSGVVVPPGHTWTIPEGVIMKAVNGGIFVQGTLSVQGTATNRVVFTSGVDDANGGDTNQDGNGTSPGPGQWPGIAFDRNSSGHVIEYANINYANGNGASIGGLSTNGAPTTLRNVTVHAAAGTGIDFGSGILNPPIVENCTINHCTGVPIANVHWDFLPGIINMTASGNEGGDFTLLGAAATSDVTIRPINLINSTASIPGPVMDVSAGVTVTIDPGCVFKFGYSPSGLVRVFGNLQCLGTPSNPVVFTSFFDDTVAGDTGNDSAMTSASPNDWRGLWLGNAGVASRIENSIIRYAGTGIDFAGPDAIVDHVSIVHSAFEGMNFNANASRPQVSNCEVLNSGGVACERVHWEQLPGFTSNTASGNAGGDYIRAVGTVDEDITIGPENGVNGGAFVAINAPTLASGGHLTVLPGTIIKFESSQTLWQVLGELDLKGTLEEPVVLTSLRDDEYGGDSQNDGNITVPGLSDWRGIFQFSGALGCEFEHVLMRYCSPAASYGLGVTGGDIVLDHVRIEHGAGGGFSISALDVDATHCTAFDMGERGFRLIAGTADLVHATSVNNGTNGIEMSGGWQGKVRNSISWGNGSANFQSPPPGRVQYSNGDSTLDGIDGNIHLDPKFVDAPNGKLQLLPSSPCIDAGDPLDAVESDCSFVDMGAYPFDQRVPFTYCESTLNSEGCLPEIQFTGVASGNGGQPLMITLDEVINNSFGLLFYGLGGQAQMSFAGGTLCVGTNDFYYRMAPMLSGGNAGLPDCSGFYAYDFNAHIASGIDPRLVPGVTVNAQFWYRDANAPAGTNSSNAVQFRICP